MTDDFMEHVEREHLCLPPKDASPSVCIFAVFNDAYAPLADIARPNWVEYCTRHKYGLRFYPKAFHFDPTRPETFGDKIKHTLYYDLRGYVDIVMFLDIDSLFMNHDLTVERCLSVDIGGGIMRKPRFAWTYDENGPLSGLWIARTDDTTEKHLRAAYRYAAENNNVRHGVIEPNGISDQDAMRALMNIPPFRDTFQHCYPAADVGHCFPENYEPGKWILTFPGRTVEEKLEGMKQYADLVAR